MSSTPVLTPPCPGCGKPLAYAAAIKAYPAHECPRCYMRIKWSMPLGHPEKTEWLKLEAGK